MRKHSLFNRMAAGAARASGRPITFLLAALIVVVWAASGPVFGFGDTWQLVINTGTTIITFLMVFLIQSTQNRDTMAMQVKLDELLYVIDKANDCLLDLEQLDEDELEKIRKTYTHEAEVARGKLRAAGEAEAEADTDTDTVKRHGVTDGKPDDAVPPAR